MFKIRKWHIVQRKKKSRMRCFAEHGKVASKSQNKGRTLAFQHGRTLPCLEVRTLCYLTILVEFLFGYFCFHYTFADKHRRIAQGTRLRILIRKSDNTIDPLTCLPHGVETIIHLCQKISRTIKVERGTTPNRQFRKHH